jgi:hypothetical protein
MLTVVPVAPEARREIRAFTEIPFRLYSGDRQWVPPFRRDVAALFNRRVHPFYEHSEAAFFMARRGGQEVGRIAVLENRPFNTHHGVRHASFYCFECEDDHAVAAALVGRAAEWARARGLAALVGPKGFSALDGYGVLVEGYEHRQTMTMTNYNPAYYAALLEGLGFVKEVDFESYRLDRHTFVMPDRVRRAAAEAQRRGWLRLVSFESKRALIRRAQEIGAAYNRAFVNNWEYYPLSPREVRYLVDQVMLVADHRLIKLIANGDEIVGFLFAFPDVSAALQRARGRLSPLRIADLLVELRRTRAIALNGAGILPLFHGRGGNALLYAAIEATIRASRFEQAELPQVAETAVQMRRDLRVLNATPTKTHRVYRTAI